MTPISNTQLLEALRWRYATKAFDPNRKIPAETWATLEQAMILAPSSFGLQPYRFLVINDPATREKLLPHAWGQRQVVEASHFVVFAARTSVTEAEIDEFIQLIARTRGVATEALAGYRGMMTGMLLSEGFKPLAPHWTARQAYIALANLMTSAALLGVDTCPIEGFVPAEFDRILDLTSQGLASVACCAAGYRSAGDKYASLPKVRFERAHLIKTI
ncbi:MAG: NAD(P)H-dependent oxidoreductase [Verrucomicrobia bacterium]|nr:NAD(P)H-dependent oxidoreductase [Verrucomicrobiota bacterium]